MPVSGSLEACARDWFYSRRFARDEERPPDGQSVQPGMAIGLRHNHDLSQILTRTKSLALRHYICNYATKLNASSLSE